MANNNLTGKELQEKEKENNTYFGKIETFEANKFSRGIYDDIHVQSRGSQMKGKEPSSLSRSKQLKGNGISDYSRYY